jgi:hypothetical protein
MFKAYKFTKNPLQQEQAQNKAGGLGRTGQGRQARSIDVPTLTVTIFAVPTNRTDINNKICGACHSLVY